MDNLITNKRLVGLSPPPPEDTYFQLSPFYCQVPCPNNPSLYSPGTEDDDLPDLISSLEATHITDPQEDSQESPSSKPQNIHARKHSRDSHPGRYTVFRLIYDASITSNPAYRSLTHQKLFIQTNVLGPVKGWYLHVDGTRLVDEPGPAPEDLYARRAGSSSIIMGGLNSGPLLAKTPIGTIAAEHVDSFRETCCAVRPPLQQMHGDRRLMPWEPVEGSREWIQKAVRRTAAAGLLDVELYR